jgi:hypothetical protein
LSLAHTVGNKVENSYRRTDLPAKRAKLMQAWSAYVNSPPAAVEMQAKVLTMKRAG